VSAGETVKTNAKTGAKKAGNLQMGGLIPPKALLEIAEHYGKGAQKYAANNWRKGLDWSDSYHALFRHLMLFWDGEDFDVCKCDPVNPTPCKECGATGSKHMTAVAWHAIALMTFMDEHPELDDRFVAPDP
jgi:hypothetical protein